jgi:hypothetical protein
MKFLKMTGLITIVAAVPHIGSLLYLIFIYHSSLANWVVIEKFLISIACISGGALLWRGGIWGFRLSIIAWILVIYASSSNLYAAIFQTANTNIQSVILPKDIIISLLGCIILFILVKDLIKFRNVPQNK